MLAFVLAILFIGIFIWVVLMAYGAVFAICFALFKLMLFFENRKNCISTVPTLEKR